MDLQAAADALGVHYQTAYGWVRSGRLPARKVGHGYQISDSDVTTLADQRSRGTQPTSQIRVRDWPAQADQVYLAIADGDEIDARKLIGRLAGHVSVTDLCDKVLGPALRRIGDDWAAGKVSIAQEHRATAICERLLATHAPRPAGRPRGTAIVSTPPGERHGMPALMAAACLREDHWQVQHLSADLPAAEIGTMARQVGATLVVLSTASTGGALRADRAARVIRRVAPGAVLLTGHSGDTLSALRARARQVAG